MQRPNEGVIAKDADVTRRKFMEIGIYGITGTITVVSGVALARFAVGPSFEKEESKWIEIDAQDLDRAGQNFTQVVLEWEKKDGWLTAKAKSLAYVKQVSANEVVAINATCSHLGCIVTWKDEQKIFQCPCHNGRYDAQGRVISGPPPKPLRRHKAKIEDGRILLATETVPYGGNTHEPV